MTMDVTGSRVIRPMVGFAAASATVVLLACGMHCETEILSSTTMPESGLRAVVFYRGCGATVGFGWEVAVLEPGQELSDDRTVFVMDNPGRSPGSLNVRVRWLSQDTLSVTYAESARVFKRLDAMGSTHISYTLGGES